MYGLHTSIKYERDIFNNQLLASEEKLETITKLCEEKDNALQQSLAQEEKQQLESAKLKDIYELRIQELMEVNKEKEDFLKAQSPVTKGKKRLKNDDLQRLDVVVTSCEACHKDATCRTSPGVPATRTCSCGDGFVGDGLTCYNRTACSGDPLCCRSGYRWSTERGCTDVDECALPGGACAPSLVCENTPGSYDCLLPHDGSQSNQQSGASSEPRPDSHSLLFGCGDVVCPAGEDCVSVDGTPRCLDPCQHYSILNHPWRATDFTANHSVPVCDSRDDWHGWYRLYLGESSVQMPDRCIERHRCGTDAPLWLKTPHPAVQDGIVKRRVCGSWEQGCCQFESNPIHVKACPGNYFVYKLVSTSACRLGYCADVNTAVCGTCREDETCVRQDKITWRCERQVVSVDGQIRLSNGNNYCSGRVEIFHNGQWGTVCDDIWDMNNAAVVCRQMGCGRAVSAHSSAHFGPGSGPIWLDNVQCTGSESALTQCTHLGFGTHNCGHGEDAGVICSEPSPVPTLQLVCGRSFLQAGLLRNPLGVLGLNASSAHLADFRCSAQENSSAVWFQVERREGSCGTQLRTNGTHAVYSNSLFVYPVTEEFSHPVSFPFSCVYPLDVNASLGVAIKPFLNMEEVGVVGMGPRARATMSLYRNANYTDPYTTGAVVLPLGSALHVGVSVEEADVDRFAVILEDCYATPSTDPQDPVQHFLIQSRCPSNPRLVTIEESRPPLQRRFSALLFLFMGDYENFYLHCSLSLCDDTEATCSQLTNSLLEKWQPLLTFSSNILIMAAEVLTMLIFVWQTVLTIKEKDLKIQERENHLLSATKENGELKIEAHQLEQEKLKNSYEQRIKELLEMRRETEDSLNAKIQEKELMIKEADSQLLSAMSENGELKYERDIFNNQLLASEEKLETITKLCEDKDNALQHILAQEEKRQLELAKLKENYELRIQQLTKINREKEDFLKAQMAACESQRALEEEREEMASFHKQNLYREDFERRKRVHSSFRKEQHDIQGSKQTHVRKFSQD
ncbi:uromodulin-like [Megalops cyprinoides]|uniref:uromodulin-like n=1 Tax=Megalops cyprinoides TaxID=118141 RepID=UPI0018645CA7|nr:uromodulin-like [Megalops cyprinoides]